MTTYYGIAAFVFPVIALLVLIDSATLVGLRNRIRALEDRIDALTQERAANPAQRVQDRPEPPPGHTDTPQRRTDALKVTPESPREWLEHHPSTVAMPAARPDPFEPNQPPPARPWQEDEIDRWRAQQARRTHRREESP